MIRTFGVMPDSIQKSFSILENLLRICGLCLTNLKDLQTKV